MKPKDLRRPYRWEQRRVLIQDGILYVPDFYPNYRDFSFPGWAELFGSDQPVHVEYCSGNGRWIIERVQSEPDKNWVAVEMRFDRVRKIWSKIQNLGLSNLFIVCGEACLATHHYFPAESVAQAYVNFPDPWPKDRHAKHRLIQADFIKEVSRILCPEGKLTLVTDDVPYSEQMLAELEASELLKPTFPAPHFIHEWEDYGRSWFEDLWREKGADIRYIQYSKCPQAVEV